MKKYSEFVTESKEKSETKSFPNTSQGAVDAFHHTAQKSLHAKDHSEYKVSSVGSHAWLLSHPKKKYSAIVYPQGGEAHVGRKGHADFEMVDDHEKAMKHHGSIQEAKEETHFIGGRDVSGITTTPKKDYYDQHAKAFDVHYKGEHIGHVATHETSAVQKKNSVRMVDSGKRRTKWLYQHKTPGSRTNFNYNSKKDATAELVGHHLRSKGEY